jgi:pilus assembly protein Flp/PilA
MVELTQRYMAAVQVALSRLRSREEGQTLVEYALIIALVSIALITALGAMTTALDGVFAKITSVLNGLPKS